jgi:LL-diaminopimelate aminotransferase
MYLWIALPADVPSAAFADRLLDEEGVVVMPGSSFGAGGEGFFRISFITSPERIGEAARRAGKVLSKMRDRRISSEGARRQSEEPSSSSEVGAA